MAVAAPLVAELYCICGFAGHVDGIYLSDVLENI